jgi:hypothetical protein
MPIKKAIEMFPDGCDDWGVSLEAFIKDEEAKEHDKRI